VGVFSLELETWISGIAAIERARSQDRGAASVNGQVSSVIAELERLLAVEPLITGEGAAPASCALDLDPDEYVQAPRSTLMRARDWLERLSSGVED